MSDSNGKLLVYASKSPSQAIVVEGVNLAVAKIAQLFNLGSDTVLFDEEGLPIYVYYKNGREDPVPIYCNKRKEIDSSEVYDSLRKMIYVLSFHPKFSMLKSVRKDITRFS
jgi:hypothetical protein